MNNHNLTTIQAFKTAIGEIKTAIKGAETPEEKAELINATQEMMKSFQGFMSDIGIAPEVRDINERIKIAMTNRENLDSFISWILNNSELLKKNINDFGGDCCDLTMHLHKHAFSLEANVLLTMLKKFGSKLAKTTKNVYNANYEAKKQVLHPFTNFRA